MAAMILPRWQGRPPDLESDRISPQPLDSPPASHLSLPDLLTATATRDTTTQQLSRAFPSLPTKVIERLDSIPSSWSSHVNLLLESSG